MAFPNKTKFVQDEPWNFYIPRSDTVKDFEYKIKRLLQSHYYNTRQQKTFSLNQFRIWKCLTEEIAKIHAWDGEMEADIYKIDAEPCNMLESDKSNKIEDLNFIDGTIFLVEVPK